MPQVYVILGARGSGRREVVLDLIKAGLDVDEERAVVLLPAGESADPADASLESLANVQILHWSASDREGVSIPELPDAATHCFFIVDGQRDPVEQLEALRDWLAEREDLELARILAVIHSRLAHARPELHLWFDALVHFSDVVLFNRREDVPNKWFRDFEQHFKKECYPALFEFVKGGRVRNPAEILFPEPRRLSQAFDFDLEAAAGPDEAGIVDDVVDESEIGGEAYDPEDDVDATDLEDDGPATEPYFERDASGRRIKHLPDIRPHLG